MSKSQEETSKKQTFHTNVKFETPLKKGEFSAVVRVAPQGETELEGNDEFSHFSPNITKFLQNRNDAMILEKKDEGKVEDKETFFKSFLSRTAKKCSLPLYCFVIGVVALAILVGALFIVDSITDRNERTEMIWRFNQLESSFSTVMDLTFSNLKAIGAYYSSLDGEFSTSQDNFERFVENLVSEQSFRGVQAVGWVPRVFESQREEFVDGIQSEHVHEESNQPLYSNFIITKKIANGTSVANSGEPEYFPVTYIYPVAGNEAAIGFDLRSSSVRKVTLEESMRTGQQLATPKIKLVQETQNMNGFLVFTPVFRANFHLDDHLNESSYQNYTIGFANGVFRVIDIVRHVFQNNADLDVCVLDENSDVLYDTTGIPKNEQSSISEFDGVKSVQSWYSYVCDRKWTFMIVPNKIYRKKQEQSRWILHPVVLATTVVLVTFMVFTLILCQTKANQRKKFDRSVLSHLEKEAQLLERILPKEIIMKMAYEGLKVIAEVRKAASILFLDIQSFTSYCNENSPIKVVQILNRLFSKIDEDAVFYGVKKLKTMGDGYMAGVGLFDDAVSMRENTEIMLLFAVRILDSSMRILNDINRSVRIGVNSGCVVAGVVGTLAPLFDIWGGAVNVASRCESNGLTGRIQVSQIVKDLCSEDHTFEKRKEKITVKGLGEMQFYLLKHDN